MKLNILNSTFCATLSVIAISMTSCDGDERNIEGSWVSGEDRLFLNEKSLADCQVASQFTFTPDENDRSHGTVTINSDITIQDAVKPTAEVDSIISEYEITITAQSQISGTYSFSDDDDVVIALDSKTLNVSIDPEAVKFASNLISGQQSPAVEPIPRKEIADKYTPQVRGALSELYKKYAKLSDIKIKHNILSCEIDENGQDRDMTFRRAEVESE